jgi:transposase-like protein
LAFFSFTSWPPTVARGAGLNQSAAESITLRARIKWPATGASVTEIAEKLGVCRQTVSEWRNHHPTFQATLKERRKELWSASTDRLRSLLPPALDLLEREIQQGNVKAALALIRSAVPLASQILTEQQQGVVFNDNRQVSVVGKDYGMLKQLTPLQRDLLRRRIQAELEEVRKLAPDK